MARLIARMDPVMIPGVAEGKVMFQTTCQGVHPMPNPPSRREEGTARKASCDEMMTTGSTTSIRVSEPAKTE